MHDPVTQAPPAPTTPRGPAWTVARVGGVLGVVLATLALYTAARGYLGDDIALAQDVEDTARELAVETSERMEGDAEIADDVAAVEGRVSTCERTQATTTAHLEAIDAQLDDIKAGQAQQLKILIQIASGD